MGGGEPGKEDQQVSMMGKDYTIKKKKKKGGMGIKNARDMHTTFPTKLGWNILTNKEKLWVKVHISKYMKKIEGVERIKIKVRVSNVWRGSELSWP